MPTNIFSMLWSIIDSYRFRFAFNRGLERHYYRSTFIKLKRLDTNAISVILNMFWKFIKYYSKILQYLYSENRFGKFTDQLLNREDWN